MLLSKRKQGQTVHKTAIEGDASRPIDRLLERRHNTIKTFLEKKAKFDTNSWLYTVFRQIQNVTNNSFKCIDDI